LGLAELRDINGILARKSPQDDHQERSKETRTDKQNGNLPLHLNGLTLCGLLRSPLG
jgi:hypothetical protein